MADLATVVAAVRDQLAVLANRRGELQAQLATVDREHDRLATAISVMEEHLKKRPGPSPTDQLAAPRPLAEEVLNELAGSTGKTRADLLRVFRPRGINPNTVGSAVSRLRARGLVVKQGRYFCAVPQGAPSNSSSSSADVASVGSNPDRSPSDVDPDPT